MADSAGTAWSCCRRRLRDRRALRYGPHRAKARKQDPLGAVLATAVLVAASLFFSLFVANFANFDKTYGPLGAIVALLFWFYVSAFFVLLGAAGAPGRSGELVGRRHRSCRRNG